MYKHPACTALSAVQTPCIIMQSAATRSSAMTLVSIVAATGGFLSGYDTVVINGTNQYLTTRNIRRASADELIPNPRPAPAHAAGR